MYEASMLIFEAKHLLILPIVETTPDFRTDSWVLSVRQSLQSGLRFISSSDIQPFPSLF